MSYSLWRVENDEKAMVYDATRAYWANRKDGS